jgi:hypothetical protein
LVSHDLGGPKTDAIIDMRRSTRSQKARTNKAKGLGK